MSIPDLLNKPTGQPLVLVIEDDFALLEDVTALLELGGYQVEGASTGTQGLQLLAARLPDVILCDITLPDTDGYAILKLLRENQATAAVPFIFLTGRAERHEIRAGMSLGADDYLTKPFTRDELMTAIHSRLQHRSATNKAESRRVDETWASVREDERLLYAHLLERQVERTLQSANMILSTAKFAAQSFDKTRLQEIETLLDQAMLYLQEITMDMDARLLEQLGLVSTIYWYLERYNRRYDTHITLAHGDVREKSLSESTRKQCFRLVQEFCLHLLPVFKSAGVTLQLEHRVDHGANVLFLRFVVDSLPPETSLSGTETAARFAELEHLVQGYRGTLLLREEAQGLTIEVRMAAGSGLLPSLPTLSTSETLARKTRATLTPAAPVETTAPSTAPIRIALVCASEDRSAVLNQRIGQQPDMAIVLVGVSVEEICNNVVSTAVDIVLLDVMDAEGTYSRVEAGQIAQILADLKGQFDGTSVIVMVTPAALSVATAALTTGIGGVLDRQADANELFAALRLVRSGHRYLGSPYLDEAINYFTQTHQVFGSIEGYNTLTRREQELLWWVASGYTSAEIAQHFSLSPRTVETHRNNIMAKLNLQNRSELTRLSLHLHRRVGD